MKFDLKRYSQRTDGDSNESEIDHLDYNVEEEKIDYPSNDYLTLTLFKVKMLGISLSLNFLHIISLTPFRPNVSSILILPNKKNMEQMLRAIPRICKCTAKFLTHDIFLMKLKSELSWRTRCYTTSAIKRSKFFSSTKSTKSSPKDSTDSNNSNSRFAPIYRFFAVLKWTPIPLSLGFALLAYQHYRRVTRRERNQIESQKPQLARHWEVNFYRLVPLRLVSRVWGWINNWNVPVSLRKPFFGWYVNKFNCDISEAEIENLESYNNLSEFFRRKLKPHVRPIDQESSIVSPSDGTVLHFGQVDSGQIEQVKNVTYSFPAFLGQPTWKDGKSSLNNNLTIENQNIDFELNPEDVLLNQEGTALYHCVFYLAPGDYHRFHSPVSWDVEFRRHFSGELLSVNPSVAAWISGLFSLNERAVYTGKWKHGFFSLTAIGATNVGSIKINGDQELTTNIRGLRKNCQRDKWFDKPLRFEKGDYFGEFNLGSTIVLIFEAPLNFEFPFEAGYKIHFGESIISSNLSSSKKKPAKAIKSSQNNHEHVESQKLVS